MGHNNSVISTNQCVEYSLEKDNFKVAQLEIGYFDYGAITDQGVIWIRLLMRDSANSGPSDTDVTVTVGKEETTMFKKTIKF